MSSPDMDSQETAATTRNLCFLCSSSEANDLCPRCQNCWFCPDHKSLHSSSDTTADGCCYPVRVVWKQGVGRCLVATRDVEPGCVLLRDRPAAAGPKVGLDLAQLEGQVCIECLSLENGSGATIACPEGCGFRLCSRRRVTTCWSRHRPLFCKAMAKIRALITQIQGGAATPAGLLLGECVAPLRLFLAQSENPALRGTLALLTDHRPEEQESLGPDEWGLRYEAIADLIDRALDSVDAPMLVTCADRREALLRCIGLLRINCLDFAQGRGRALFPVFSFMSHSCLSNAKHSVAASGEEIMVVSQKAIRAGEEVTITYTNLLRPTWSRNRQLQAKWHFTCSCPRCLDPDELGVHVGQVRCPSCRKGFLRRRPLAGATTTFQCSASSGSETGCGSAFSEASVSSLVDSLDWLLQESDKAEEPLEDFLKLTQDILHETHFLRIIAKRYLSQVCSAEAPLRKIQLCSELMAVFDALDHGLSQSRGLTLVELSSGILQGGGSPHVAPRYADALQNLEEAIRCLEHDPDGGVGAKTRQRARAMIKSARDGPHPRR